MKRSKVGASYRRRREEEAGKDRRKAASQEHCSFILLFMLAINAICDTVFT